MLFLIHLTGSYALEVRVIRASSANEARAQARSMFGEPFDSVKVVELDPEGEPAELFAASFIE